MPSTSLAIERVLSLLRDAPTRLAALTADLSPEELQMRPTPEEWSASAGTRLSAGVCRRSGAATSERSSPRTGLSLGRSVPAPGSSRRTILTWHFGPRSVPLWRSVPSCWLSSPRYRLIPGNARREFRRWEGSSKRPCSPMRSGYLSMYGRTSSKSQASRA